jgi:hypothetical protein
MRAIELNWQFSGNPGRGYLVSGDVLAWAKLGDHGRFMVQELWQRPINGKESSSAYVVRDAAFASDSDVVFSSLDCEDCMEYVFAVEARERRELRARQRAQKKSVING